MVRNLIVMVLVVLVWAAADVGAAIKQDSGPDGIVSIEAEHWDVNIEKPPHIWEFTTEVAGFIPFEGFSGEGAMQVGPMEPSSHFYYGIGEIDKLPRLDYAIEFVKTGTHYLWMLGYGVDAYGDSCHAGLDGVGIADKIGNGKFGNYVWARATQTFEIPSAGLHTLNIWMREDGFSFDKVVLTTDANFTPTGHGPEESISELKVSALYPTDGSSDIPRDGVVLSWKPDKAATQHNVYFGTDFDDVNNATAQSPAFQGSQTETTLALDRLLEMGRTYYWRIDEVSPPPGLNIFKGNVWSFTVEPFAYIIQNITATASNSFSEDRGPEKTIDGSGLNASGLHSTEETDMWLSSADGPQPTWIQYEFDRAYKLYDMLVWNYNQDIEPVVDFGLKNVTIEYSTDGSDWTQLGDAFEFAQGPRLAGSTPNTAIDFGGLVARYVKITANSNWGGLSQYGLSEVQFLYQPLRPRGPMPAFGEAGAPLDVVLGWRAGREAASHKLYFSSDMEAVMNGTALVDTFSQSSYEVGPLEFGTTYYWKINEVNETEYPATWEGDIWNFTTQEYLVVDDFESYNEIPVGEEGSNLVYMTWVDGYENPTNGSTMGHSVAFEPSMENVIVHEGVQSAPLYYDNTTAEYSEVTANISELQVGQDWTKHGIKTLSLWFYGDPNNALEQMYVRLNGSKVVYDSDADNITRKPWEPWNIELAEFTSVDLSNVTELAIGFERTGSVGGTGVVYLDDIRLYPYSRELALATPVEPDTAGLVGHWQFEGNYDDSSGNGHHGSALGDPTFVAGKSGQAISLDGVDDCVEITGYKGILGTNAFSVTAWIKTAGNGAIISWGKGEGPWLGENLEIWVNDNKIRLKQGGDQFQGKLTGNTNVTDDVWYHVAITHKENGILLPPDTKIYINGALDSTSSGDRNQTIIEGVYDVTIGRALDSDAQWLGGLLDDVRMYDYALSHEEIGWLAGRTKPFDEPY